MATVLGSNNRGRRWEGRNSCRMLKLMGLQELLEALLGIVLVPHMNLEELHSVPKIVPLLEGPNDEALPQIFRDSSVYKTKQGICKKRDRVPN